MGTVVNTAAVPVCSASDPTLMLLGPSACPGSTVGDAHLTVDFGAGMAVPFTVTLINAGTQVLFLGQNPTTGIRLGGHGKLLGSTISIDVPNLPGLGRGGAVVRDEDFTFSAATGFLTSPRSCPTGGAWNFVRDHTPTAMVVTQTATVPIPCATPPSRACAPRPPAHPPPPSPLLSRRARPRQQTDLAGKSS